MGGLLKGFLLGVLLPIAAFFGLAALYRLFEHPGWLWGLFGVLGGLVVLASSVAYITTPDQPKDRRDRDDPSRQAQRQVGRQAGRQARAFSLDPPDASDATTTVDAPAPGFRPGPGNHAEHARLGSTAFWLKHRGLRRPGPAAPDPIKSAGSIPGACAKPDERGLGPSAPTAGGFDTVSVQSVSKRMAARWRYEPPVRKRD